MALMGVQNTLRVWVKHAMNGVEMPIPAQDLRVIYTFMSGKDMSLNHLGNFLKDAQLEVKRSQYPYNKTAKDTRRPRCISVVWKFDEEMVHDLRVGMNMVDGVTPIAHPQSPENNKEAI